MRSIIDGRTSLPTTNHPPPNTPLTQGEMFINGAPLDDHKFLRISEYVQHEDVFVPTQTLLQALEYHANLRLGPGVTRAEKRRRIDALLLVRAWVVCEYWVARSHPAVCT